MFAARLIPRRPRRAAAGQARAFAHTTAAPANPRVAILYQAVPSPTINGIRKPRKAGGYQDSGADLGFLLRSQPDIGLIAPAPSPVPAANEGWCFPDTESGILSALAQGATHLWANTLIFAAHPLQTSPLLDPYSDTLLISQPPLLVEKYDDKAWTNDLLRSHGFTLPRAWLLTPTTPLPQQITYPIIAKPIRGRGSQGVRLCHTLPELQNHIASLADSSPVVLLEEYLEGQEATVTVLPPSPGKEDYWALPVVERFGHHDGVAPYNGVVPVAANSTVVSGGDSGRYGGIVEECVSVARLLGVTSPVRIDVREGRGGFALFDVNMKPNITGPGRPGREEQVSLMGIAAEGLGWDYGKLVRHILGTARSLGELRAVKPFGEVCRS